MKQAALLVTLLVVSCQLVSCAEDDENRILLRAISSAFEESSFISSRNHEDELDSKSSIPQVKITSGLLTGRSLAEGHGFYSVPYAEPPVGDKRFARTELLGKFSGGEFNANVIDQITCYQRPQDECSNGLCLTNVNESCLVLNVHVPKLVDLSNSDAPPNSRLPVLVWIHGGGLQTGSGTAPLYDGRYLSNFTNTIVVSVNYRLGIFGFMPVRENDDVTTNQGFHDQQLALKWIQENIEQFGGDKSKVTIFGQSAGAQLVMFHLMSQVSARYFQHAILEGQPAIFQYANTTTALDITDNVLAKANCTEMEDPLQCLRDVSPEELVNIAGQVQVENIFKGDLFGAISPFSLVLDGEEFSENPLQFVQQGNWIDGLSRVAIMGTNIEEMNNVEVFIPDFFEQLISREAFEALLKFTLGDEVGAMVGAKYDTMVGDFDNNYVRLLGEVITDGFFICPTRALARLATQLTDIYLYSFAHAMDDPSCETSWQPGGSCEYVYHSSEHSFVFRSAPLIPYNFSTNDVIAANQFSYYWGNLAYSGDPSSSDVTTDGDFFEWPKYSADVTPEKARQITTLNLGPWTNYVIDAPEGKYDQYYKEEICDFWDSTKFYVDLNEDDTTASTPYVFKTLAYSTADIMETSTSTADVTTTNDLLEETTSSANQVTSSVALFIVLYAVSAVYLRG